MSPGALRSSTGRFRKQQEGRRSESLLYDVNTVWVPSRQQKAASICSRAHHAAWMPGQHPGTSDPGLSECGSGHPASGRAPDPQPLRGCCHPRGYESITFSCPPSPSRVVTRNKPYDISVTVSADAVTTRAHMSTTNHTAVRFPEKQTCSRRTGRLSVAVTTESLCQNPRNGGAKMRTDTTERCHLFPTSRRPGQR